MKWVAVAVLLLCACASSAKRTAQEQAESAKREAETMGSYVGHPVSDLMRNWGPPTREDPDGKGGWCWSYNATYPQFYGTATLYFTRSRRFFINRAGTIYYTVADTRPGY